MTSTGQLAAPTQPVSSAQLIDLADLPIERTDIELSAPADTLWPENVVADTRKILALVRLHSHPLGVVVLDGNSNHDWRAHSATVWSVLREAINSHLAADGLPQAHEPDDLIAGHGAPPLCVRQRYDGLPRALAHLEKRGLVCGPAAYAVSRLRAHRAAKRDD